MCNSFESWRTWRLGIYQSWIRLHDNRELIFGSVWIGTICCHRAIIRTEVVPVIWDGSIVGTVFSVSRKCGTTRSSILSCSSNCIIRCEKSFDIELCSRKIQKYGLLRYNIRRKCTSKKFFTRPYRPICHKAGFYILYRAFYIDISSLSCIIFERDKCPRKVSNKWGNSYVCIYIYIGTNTDE